MLSKQNKTRNNTRGFICICFVLIAIHLVEHFRYALYYTITHKFGWNGFKEQIYFLLNNVGNHIIEMKFNVCFTYSNVIFHRVSEIHCYKTCEFH